MIKCTIRSSWLDAYDVELDELTFRLFRNVRTEGIEESQLGMYSEFGCGYK